MSDAEIVQRYRHLREVASEIQDAALHPVTSETMIEFGRRLGALRYGRVALEDDNDLKLLYDLVIHTARPGRSRALDRYARTVAFATDSDEDRVLKALQTARVRAFCIKRRHPVAGAIADDMIAGEEFHLMDIAIGMSSAPGAMFVGRLAGIEGFEMSCLTVVPIDLAIMERLMRHGPSLNGGTNADPLQDPRFAIAIYRGAIELGTMRRCVTFDPATAVPTQAEIDSLMATTGRRSVDLPAWTAVG